MINVLGKQSFVSKSGKDCFILFYAEEDERVEGFRTDSCFVSEDLFKRVSVRTSYEVVYGKNYNGNAFIKDLVQT